MSSAETDRRDAQERAAIIERALTADRAGRDRLRDRADVQPKREQGTGTPNTGGRS